MSKNIQSTPKKPLKDRLSASARKNASLVAAGVALTGVGIAASQGAFGKAEQPKSNGSQKNVPTRVAEATPTATPKPKQNQSSERKRPSTETEAVLADSVAHIGGNIVELAQDYGTIAPAEGGNESIATVQGMSGKNSFVLLVAMGVDSSGMADPSKITSVAVSIQKPKDTEDPTKPGEMIDVTYVDTGIGTGDNKGWVSSGNLPGLGKVEAEGSSSGDLQNAKILKEFADSILEIAAGSITGENGPQPTPPQSPESIIS